MAIVYPLALPSSPAIRRISWAPQVAAAERRSPFSLKRQVHLYDGRMWAGQFTLPPMERAAAEEWLALQLALDGPAGTFLLPDPDGATPRGPAGTIAPRQNDITNNTMVGAVAATDTIPNGWVFNDGGMGATVTVDAVGVEGGIEVIDVTMAGTNSTGSNKFPWIAAADVTEIAAVQNDERMSSVYLKLTGGAMSHDLRHNLAERNSGGGFLNSVSNTLPLTGTLARDTRAKTVVDATAAYVQPRYLFDIPDTEALNASFRIGLPQIEPGLTASPVVRTSGTARSRPAGPYVEGAGQSGLQLRTGGWSPETTPLLVGDLIQLGSGDTTRMHKVLTAQATDVAGDVLLDIWPALRESPADGAAIVTSGCKFAAALAGNAMPWDVDDMMHYGLTVSFAEAF